MWQILFKFFFFQNFASFFLKQEYCEEYFFFHFHFWYFGEISTSKKKGKKWFNEKAFSFKLSVFSLFTSNTTLV
jgi:hypothetical protein